MRLIDADALWKLVKNFRDTDPEKMTKRKNVCNAILLILLDEREVPTIDPESLRPKWISVEDRLPEYDQVVLCYKDGRGVRIGKHMPATYADGVVAFKDLVRDYAFGATHWMPLPEPPNADMRGE